MSEQATDFFLDRAAFYDGKLAGLGAVQNILKSAIRRLGPPPPPTAPAYVVLAYQVHVATLTGTLFREMGEALQRQVAQAESERQVLLKDKSVVIDGGKVH